MVCAAGNASIDYRPFGPGPTCTSSLPKFIPVNSILKAVTAFSRPATTSSLYLTLPFFTHWAMSLLNSGCYSRKSVTMKPRKIRRLSRMDLITSRTLSGPGGNLVALYCGISPQTGMRPKGSISARTDWKTFPPTFSKSTSMPFGQAAFNCSASPALRWSGHASKPSSLTIKSHFVWAIPHLWLFGVAPLSGQILAGLFKCASSKPEEPKEFHQGQVTRTNPLFLESLS